MLKSISAKLLFRMVLVTIIGLVIGLSLILKFSSDLKNSTAENLTTEKREQALDADSVQNRNRFEHRPKCRVRQPEPGKILSQWR